MWVIMVGFPPISSTDYALQCPVDNYSVQCATMYFQLNGLAVTYHFSPGTCIYTLLTSSWCMWCIFNLKHALALFFIDKTSHRAFKTWNSLRSAGLTAQYTGMSKLLSGTALRGGCLKGNHYTEKLVFAVASWVCVLRKKSVELAYLCMCLGVFSCIHVALKFV